MNELWLAVSEGDARWVKELLMAGRCPHTRYKGWTPFMKAAEDDKVDIMKLLLKYRAEPDAMNYRGRTALSFAAAPSNERRENRRRESSLDALRLLLSLEEVWVLREDLSGMTARARAMGENRHEAADLLARAEGRCFTSSIGNAQEPGQTDGSDEESSAAGTLQGDGMAEIGSCAAVDDTPSGSDESTQEELRVAPDAGPTRRWAWEGGRNPKSARILEGGAEADVGDATGAPTCAGKPRPPEGPPPPYLREEASGSMSVADERAEADARVMTLKAKRDKLKEEIALRKKAMMDDFPKEALARPGGRPTEK